MGYMLDFMLASYGLIGGAFGPLSLLRGGKGVTPYRTGITSSTYLVRLRVDGKGV